MMRVKATSRIEGIFSHAVAMDNRGIKNMVHCVASNIFVVNFDYSMILRFSLRRSETSFESPVSFNANEYDSPDFSFTEDDEGGKIIFHNISGSKEYHRKKICRTTNSGPDAKDISKLYRQLKKKAEESEYLFHLSNECVPLLEEGLSHTEISVEKSALVIRQRNVYTGTVIEITPIRESGFSLATDKLPKSMAPFALKTKDFASLFIGYKTLTFVPTEDFIMVKDQKGDFDGILSLCTYDAIIDLFQDESEVSDDGREKQEARSSEQETDRSSEKTRRRRRA